ncbi:deaminase domain-containing protein [Pseudomonas asplenii]|uniref:deaminase domain-containing protein n=1 Tax=Pseudomonas asplenii TaxID=53407 RepID=UPI0018DED0B6|nr:deaminase domain-containing protein [Pseudomonas fuscovaginae]
MERLEIRRKWAQISSQQDTETAIGFLVGLNEGGWKDISGIASFMANPKQGMKGLYELIHNPEVVKTLSSEAFASLEASYDRINYALEYGGDAQAVLLGRDLGLLLQTTASLATDVGGVAKAGAVLGKVGIEASSKLLNKLSLKKSAELEKDVAKLEASTAKNFNSSNATVGAEVGHSNIPVINAEVMKQSITAMRSTLTSDLKRGGNMAVADVAIEGLPSVVAAHSGISTPTAAQAAMGIVGRDSVFETFEVANKAGVLTARAGDSEANILSSLARQLGDRTDARGTVMILTERAACASCLGVASQFKSKYPGVMVYFMDNNGVILRPVATGVK